MAQDDFVVGYLGQFCLGREVYRILNAVLVLASGIWPVNINNSTPPPENRSFFNKLKKFSSSGSHPSRHACGLTVVLNYNHLAGWKSNGLLLVSADLLADGYDRNFTDEHLPVPNRLSYYLERSRLRGGLHEVLPLLYFISFRGVNNPVIGVSVFFLQYTLIRWPFHGYYQPVDDTPNPMTIYLTNSYCSINRWDGSKHVKF